MKFGIIKEGLLTGKVMANKAAYGVENCKKFDTVKVTKNYRVEVLAVSKKNVSVKYTFKSKFGNVEFITVFEYDNTSYYDEKIYKNINIYEIKIISDNVTEKTIDFKFEIATAVEKTFLRKLKISS